MDGQTIENGTDRPQTAAETLERIRSGTEPWVAIGDLLDDWRCSDAPAWRAMTDDPPAAVESIELRRWAAFIAAAIDQLSWEAVPRVDPLEWVGDDHVLPEPWFLLPGWRLRMHQLVDTPAAFKRRNIYGGDRILSRV